MTIRRRSAATVNGWPTSAPRLERNAAREPEVEHLDPSLRRDHDVRAFEVAMDDAMRARGPAPRRSGFRRRAASPAGGPGRGRCRSAASLDVLHHDVRLPVGLADVEDRADVRVAQRGQRLRFPLQALPQARVAAASTGRTLTATSRSRRVSRARYTSPIPPAPIRASMR